MTFRYFKYLFLCTLFVSFCLGCNPKENVSAPDVSHLDVEAKINRFDRLLIESDTIDPSLSLSKLKAQFPNMFEVYFNNIIPIYDEDALKFSDNFSNYINSEATKRLYDTVFIEFSNLQDLEEQFSTAFKYYKYYFDDFTTPNIYTVVSDFGYQNFIIDDEDRDGIGIGLDMYLGSTFPYKSIDPQNPSFSDYLTRFFNKDHIVSKSLMMLLNDQVGAPSGVRLLDQMIHNGKKLYILDLILPYTNDTVIVEYSALQLDWVRANEIQIWSYFTDENLLYETNMSKINKYLRPAPSSPGMPPESPGSTASYIGWQIVKSYMKKYPETTLIDLIALEDSQKLLEKSRYRPKNR